MSDPSLPARRPEGWEPSSAELSRPFDPRIGTAYAVGVRSENVGDQHASTTVLTFRLRRVDPNGVELPPLSVEMRGTVLNGTVAEGDLIRLPDAAPLTGALHLKTVQNLTMNAPVTTRSTMLPAWVGITFLVVFAALMLVVIAVIGFGVFAMSGS